MSTKLLTEHYLEFLRLKGDCTGSSESTIFKMPHCCGPNVLPRYCTFAIISIGRTEKTPLSHPWIINHCQDKYTLPDNVESNFPFRLSKHLIALSFVYFIDAIH